MVGVREFYKDRVILITGATGFMGKVLLEKILRTIPDFKRIYILIRTKRDVLPEERIKVMLSRPPFTLNSIDEKQFAKVLPIYADISQDGLGISVEDKETIINEISVVFHFAASIRFDLPLRDALNVNVISTKKVMTLCTEIKNLVSVVHLSTTYCNIDIEYMEEKVYDIEDRDPYQLMDMVTWLDDKSLAKLEKSLIKPHPNTYTFTKRLTEILVRDFSDKLPIVIVRPSIVVPAYKEPIPGWVDSLNGPMGILLAAGKGVMRVIHANVDTYPQAVPVDIAINCTILAGSLRSTQSVSVPRVYNVSQGDIVKLTWREATEKCRNFALQYPLKKVLWYPNGFATTNILLYKIIIVLFHFVPAYIVDTLMVLFLQPPFLVNVQKRLVLGLDLISYFTMFNFVFVNDNAIAIGNHADLSQEERDIYYITNIEFDLDKYLLAAFLTSRKYCLKNEEFDNSPIWKIQLGVYYILDRVLKIAILFFALRFLLSLFGWADILTCSYWRS